MFNDEVNPEYMEFKKANDGDFSWWNYINMKSDLKTALGFAKFYYPDFLEVEGCILLKDNFSVESFELWKIECGNEKSSIEKMMNLYQIKDFFHINAEENEEIDDQIMALSKVLKKLWTICVKEKYPNRDMVVDILKEEDNALFITVYEEV